jgi:hypothetical protein
MFHENLKCRSSFTSLQRLAVQSIQILMNMMASASRSVKIALAHSVFDIFLVHEAAILKNQDNNVSFFLMWPS